MLLAGLVAACAPTERTIRPDLPSFSAPAIDPLPLAVGYVLAEGLDRPLVHRVGASDAPSATYTFELGPPSRAMFERLLPALFAEAKAGEAPDGASGTILIDLVRAHAQSVPPPAYASVTYALRFIAPDGSEAGVWEVQETSRGGDSPKEETMRAMRLAATTIAFGMAERPEVRAWLATADVADDDAAAAKPAEAE